MRRRRVRGSWYRRNAAWIALGVGVLVMGVVLLWPRQAAYARYADGVRPSVVFVWSDPTPHHPHG